MPKKIVIIGAGPVGCYAAGVLKTCGYNPLLIEEHAEVGRPVHCTGLVGGRVFESAGIKPKLSSSVINTINGAVIHYNRQSFMIRRKSVAYVIDRERFDKGLSEGLNILFQNKFLGLEKNKSGYIIETDKTELYADIIIGADGANSLLRGILNKNGNIRQYRGVQFRLKARPRHKDLVEVYLKKPHFFWIVPETEDVVRVGTISENPYRDLNSFCKEIRIKGEILERFGGLVSVGICEKTVKDNIALVGDAACQLKPLTYGGIYFGLQAAGMLAACIKEGRLEDYDARWKKELAFEIKVGLKIKDIYNRLEADEFKKIFAMIKKNKNLIERRADFENHSRLVLEMLKKPSLYSQAGYLFRIFLKKIL